MSEISSFRSSYVIVDQGNSIKNSKITSKEIQKPFFCKTTWASEGEAGSTKREGFKQQPREGRRHWEGLRGKLCAPQSPTTSQTNSSSSSGKNKVMSTPTRCLYSTDSFLQMSSADGDESMAECWSSTHRALGSGFKTPGATKRQKKMCKTRMKTWDWEIHLSYR